MVYPLRAVSGRVGERLEREDGAGNEARARRPGGKRPPMFSFSFLAGIVLPECGLRHVGTLSFYRRPPGMPSFILS